jgi:hypothetical protein
MYPVFLSVQYAGYVPLMSLDEAREQLAPATEALLITPRRNAVKTWSTFETGDPLTASGICAATRAAMIHDFTVAEVRRSLERDDVKGVAREIESDLEFFTVAVGSDLLLRYKQVVNGLPRNVPTEVQQLLARQQYKEETMSALSAEGMPTPPTFITCGYKLDADGSLDVITVQCDYYKNTLWRYVVWGEDGEGFGTYENLPLDPTLSPDATIVRSARKEETRRDSDSKK